jgi:hypothetical protein
MHTKDNLATELTKAGLSDMAAKASEGYYHDYLSPLVSPSLQLVSDLHRVGTPEAGKLAIRAMDGEFDATFDEAQTWASSEEGMDAFRRLVRE